MWRNGDSNLQQAYGSSVQLQCCTAFHLIGHINNILYFKRNLKHF